VDVVRASDQIDARADKERKKANEERKHEEEAMDLVARIIEAYDTDEGQK
jgi:hypothetical protein